MLVIYTLRGGARGGAGGRYVNPICRDPKLLSSIYVSMYVCAYTYVYIYIYIYIHICVFSSESCRDPKLLSSMSCVPSTRSLLIVC